MDIQINDMKVHYKVSGEGIPVILLHGWGVNLDAFQPIHRFLEKEFKVYSLDAPGFGESSEPPEQWGVADYSALLREFILSLNIESPIIIGHSFGGRMAIYYASKYKDVKKMILVGSAGIKPKRKWSYYGKVYSFKAAKQLLKLPGLNKNKEDHLKKVKAFFGSSDYKTASGVMQETMVKVVNEDLQHLMPDIHVPVLLIYGENDTATPVKDGQLMEKLIPDAGLVVVKNAGHYAYLDQPHMVQAVIDNFLDKNKRSKKQ